MHESELPALMFRVTLPALFLADGIETPMKPLAGLDIFGNVFMTIQTQVILTLFIKRRMTLRALIFIGEMRGRDRPWHH